MQRNETLIDVMGEIANYANESDEFKERFVSLLKNTMDDTYHEDDILEVIDLISLEVNNS